MEVILLALNAKYVHSSLAVWYLAGAVSQLSRLEHNTTVIESTIHQPDSDILSKIGTIKPDVLGISVYIWNALKVEALLKRIRHCLPEVTLVLGGPEASCNAEHWLSLGTHFVIRGEGERSFPMLLDALKDPAALDAIPGLCRCLDGKTVCARTEDAKDTVIDPYSDLYWDSLSGRIAYLETSRGCPFRCSFCLSGGSRPRFFPLDTAKEQLFRLSQSGTQTIKLVDRTFNSNAERAYELFSYVIAMDTSCRFHFEVAADLFDERTLALLSAAPPGRIQLEAGLQSFHQPTLDAVARHTSIQKAERQLKSLLAGRNIHVHIDLIAGLPLETLASFKQSFNRAYAIGAHTLQLGFLKLLHGSELRAQAESWGICYSDTPPYEITGSQWLTPDELDIIKQAERSLERVYNSGRFTETVQYVLTATGLPPFELYHALGKTASGYHVPLDSYAVQLYDFFSGLPGVNIEALRDHMIVDWLCAMRGKNMPSFLRAQGSQAGRVRVYAEGFLGRRVARCEAAMLRQGGVFIDSVKIDPVTGRYALYEWNGD